MLTSAYCYTDSMEEENAQDEIFDAHGNVKKARDRSGTSTPQPFFSGREDPINMILAACSSTKEVGRGEDAVAVVQGPPGAGKSATLTQVRHLLHTSSYGGRPMALRLRRPPQNARSDAIIHEIDRVTIPYKNKRPRTMREGKNLARRTIGLPLVKLAGNDKVTMGEKLPLPDRGESGRARRCPPAPDGRRSTEHGGPQVKSDRRNPQGGQSPSR